MAKKRGRPPKKQTVVEKREAKDPIVNTAQDDSVNFGMDSREAMYEKADAFNFETAVEEPQEEVPEETEAVAETTETETEVVPEETTPETSPEEDETEPSTEKEAVEYVPESKKEEVAPVEDVKTVPLAALHEAREKEKAERARREEVERKLAEFENQKARLEEEEYETDDYRKLKMEVDELKKANISSKEAERRAETQRQIDMTHKNLISKGVEGFDTIGHKLVAAKLNEMYAVDPAYALAHNNPEGYEKIYLEMLPDLQAIGRSQHKAKLKDEKKQAKAEAGLISRSGTKSESDNEQPKPKLTPEQEYLLERSKNRI